MMRQNHPNSEESGNNGDCLPAALFNRWSTTALAVACGIVTFIAIALLGFAFPTSDDFCRAAPVVSNDSCYTNTATAIVPSEPGSFSYFKKQYFKWTGRWSAMGLEIAMLQPDPTRYYWIPLALLAGCYVLSTHIFLRAVFRPAHSRINLRKLLI